MKLVRLEQNFSGIFIEAFNARIRAECLNTSWFFSVADARERIEAWRISTPSGLTRPWVT